MTDQTKGKADVWKRLCLLWLTVENVSLFVGLIVTTIGAWQWSARAGLLTCGCLILGFTTLSSVVDALGSRGGKS